METGHFSLGTLQSRLKIVIQGLNLMKSLRGLPQLGLALLQDHGSAVSVSNILKHLLSQIVLLMIHTSVLSTPVLRLQLKLAGPGGGAGSKNQKAKKMKMS